jgi:hypothetical protein
MRTKILFGFFLFILTTCKPFLERKVMLATLPIEEKNDSTLILKAHLIDYNPKKAVKEFGFAIGIDDSTQLHTLSKKICTQHPDSVNLEHLTLQYIDTNLLYRNPTPATLVSKKVYAKSYVWLENDQIIWGNLQEIELSWGSIENISATTTSITFDYVIDWRENCPDVVDNNYGLEYGFYYHIQPNPSESNYLGKITEALGDDFLLACFAELPRYVKTITITGLQPRTTYYIRYYVIVGNEIHYGQSFSARTL